MFTFASVGLGGYSVKQKLCWTRNLRSTRVMETAIQNLAKSPWFKINNVLCKCKACYNVHVWFNHAVWLLVNRKWCYWNSRQFRQFPIITRHGNSSLVFLGLTLAQPFSEGRTLHTVDWTKVQKVPSIFNFAVQNGSENMHTVLHQRKALPQIPRSPRWDFRVPTYRGLTRENGRVWRNRYLF